MSAAISELLKALKSPANATRKQAEAAMKTDWMQGEQRTHFLLTLCSLATEADPAERPFAALILRRCLVTIPADESNQHFQRVVDLLPEPVIIELRQRLLQGLAAPEATLEARRMIADTIAEIAMMLHKPWPELLQALFEVSKSDNSELRECACRIFSTTPEIVRDSSELISAAVQMLQHNFADPIESVRVAAVNAFTAFFQSLDRDSWQLLKPLLPDLLNVMTPLREQHKDEQLTAVLESLIELVNLAPKMFKPVFREVVEFALQVAADKEMDENTRLSALEFAVTFVEDAPNMCKANNWYSPKLVLQCLQMLMEVGLDDDDAAEWNDEDDATYEEEEVHLASKAALDRLALALEGEYILPPMFEYLPALISSQEWRERHGALMALSNIAEGCHDLMVPEFGRILDMVLPLVNDPHPRVQWAACNAIGQMSTDFACEAQENFGERILPTLIGKLSNESVFRVQSHAAAAIVNFCEHATKEVLEPYLDDMLSRLVTLLEGPKRYMQEQIFTTIAMVADAARHSFAKYYDVLMPIMFRVINSATTPELRLLRAKAIECLTLVALAVGKETFRPLYNDTVQTFAQIQETAEPDDPCQSYLVQAWGRLCRIMGVEFVPLLKGVMPPLMQTASAQLDCLFLDEEQAKQMEGQEGWEVMQTGGRFIGMNTALFDDKQSAMELITVYASELGADFYSFVPDVLTSVIIPSLKFYYSESVRYVACQLIPHVIVSAQQIAERNGLDTVAARKAQEVMDVWLPCLQCMLEFIGQDEAPGMLSEVYNTIYQATQLIGPAALPPQSIAGLIAVMDQSLRDVEDRLAVRAADENDEFVEELESEEAEEYDEALIEATNKAIYSIMRTFKAEGLQFMDPLVPHIQKSIQNQSIDLREWAMYVLKDFVESASPASFQLVQQFLPVIRGTLSDQSPRIRQIGAYTVGLCAQHGGPSYTQFCVESLEPLFAIANASDSRSDSNIEAAENAVAAIAKILKSYGSHLGDKLEMALSEWIKTLPVLDDQESALFSYRFLADLMERKSPAVSADPQKTFYAVVQGVCAGSIAGKRAERVVSATKAFLASLPNNQALEMFNSLSAEDQQMVQKYFQ